MIEARGLSKHYGDKLAVDDLSFTVKTHIGHIMTKLRLRDRIQAVVYAYETGLIAPQSKADKPQGRW
jgi:ATP/maltotriose-dependent transcriptional regulator MalT